MRQLTFNEWVAVVIAIIIIMYFFFFNGTIFSLQRGADTVASTAVPVMTATTTTSTSTEIMANNTYTLPGIQVTDVVVGTGEEATPGKRVVVNYVGAFPDGRVFDSSIPRGQPFDFTLGAGEVIQGWDEGVAGMKVGGKRMLVISPEKAYGARGAGNVIPPNATLIFQVELLDVQN